MPLGIGVDPSDCIGKRQKEKCTAVCRAGFDGSTEIFRCNEDAVLVGTAPVCVPKVCSLPQSAPGLNTSACVGKIFGETCVVSCIAGYWPATAVLVCQDGTFAGSAPVCSRILCDTSTIPTGIGVNSTGCQGLLMPGESCSLGCRDGFEPSFSTMVCDGNGQLNGQLPECLRQECSVPDSFKAPSVMHDCGSSILHEATCTAQCPQGYASILPQIYQCQAPQPLSAAPACEGQVCTRNLPFGPGVQIISCALGGSCSPMCLRGFSPMPASLGITCNCGIDGALTGCAGFGCTRAKCGALVSAPGLDASSLSTTCSGQVFGQACLASCAEGYSGLPEVLRCDMAPDTVATEGFVSKDGSTLVMPVCEGNPCTVNFPSRLGIGHSCSGKTTGQSCSTFTLPGFVALGGTSELTCTSSGAFAGQVSGARRKPCPQPSFPDGTLHTCSATVFGGTCWAYCDVGYDGDPVQLQCIESSDGLNLVPLAAMAPSCSGRRLLTEDSDAAYLDRPSSNESNLSSENHSNETNASEDTSNAAAPELCNSSEAASGLQDPGVKHDCLGRTRGSLCIAECQDGFQLLGNASIFSCGENLSFVGTPPKCEPMPCEYAWPDGLGVVHDCFNATTDSSCIASCANGYSYAPGTEAQNFICGASGEFIGTSPSCVPLPCSAKAFMMDSRYSHDCDGKVNGQKCVLSCADGFSMPGRSSQIEVLRCEADGFSGNIPSCVPDPCTGSLPTDLDTTNCTGLRTNETCVASCLPGYAGGTTEFACTKFADFEGQPANCTPKACPLRSTPVDVDLLGCAGLQLGGTCSASCAAGYEYVAGSATQLECSLDNVTHDLSLQGAWPQCAAKPCVANIPSEESLSHTCDGVVTNGRCEVRCAAGYESLSGGAAKSILLCESSGSLVGEILPNCTQQVCPERMEPGISPASCTGIAFGSSCWTKCLRGFQAANLPQSWKCDVDPSNPGTVSLQGISPSCERKVCLDNLPLAVHLQSNCSGMVYGDTCHVFCNSDLGWAGEPTNITCGHDQAFYGPLPDCLLVTTSTVTSTTSTSITFTSTTSTSTVMLNLTDTVEFRGVLALNVSDAEGFVNDPQVILVLQHGLAAAHGVPLVYVDNVTVSLTPPEPPSHQRRLAGQASAVYVSYVIIMKTDHAMATEANPPSPGSLDIAINQAFANAIAFGGLDTSYSIAVSSVAAPVVNHVCGDGVRLGYELDMHRCDDGNLKKHDGCDELCYVEHGWYCAEAGRPCTSICGDGMVAFPVEECDDGNIEPYDFCSSTCMVEYGRCAVQARTVCTASSRIRGDVPWDAFCSGYNCTFAECCTMERPVQMGWNCSRGGTCSSICGDGLIVGEEACDDGNSRAGDGCSFDCQVEPGWKCAAEGEACRSFCGDGLIATPVEECDDGNLQAGDGCGSNCRWESGQCWMQGSGLCSSVPGYIERPWSNVPCHGPECTLSECCVFVDLGACPKRLYGRLTTGCEDGSGYDAGSSGERERRDCSSYSCPAGWQPRGGDIIVSCVEPLCELGSCCLPLGSSCTCDMPECCGLLQTPPEVIDGGIFERVRLNLVAPVTPFLNSSTTWFYFLNSGPTSLVDLVLALNGSAAQGRVAKGYRLSLPSSIDVLEAVFGRHPNTKSPDPDSWPNQHNHPLHVWTSMQQSPGVYMAASGRLGWPLSSYAASASDVKLVFLQVREIFTVWHGNDQLRRMQLFEGITIGSDSNSGKLQGLPAILEGASYFTLGAGVFPAPGNFSVMVAEPAVVFAIAAVDPYQRHGGKIDSGFEELGWEEVMSGLSGNLRLQPFGLHVACWKRNVAVGTILQIPHRAGLRGSLALKVAAEPF